MVRHPYRRTHGRDAGRTPRAEKQQLPMAAEIQRLLAAIDRSLADASAGSVSEATRFDAAHRAATQCAVVAMLAAGRQPADPGAPQGELLDALSQMLGVGPEVWTELDTLRRRRLAGDYDGHPITQEATAACIAQAVTLRRRLHAQLAAHHPELLQPA